jgi:glycosyltransferase involved in cell wall biosynthesis
MRILLVQDADWTKKGPHQQHHLMELLSIKGHKVQVIGYNQLWKREGWNLLSKRVDYKDVCRFYKGARVDYIQPFFIKILILDYLSFFISSRIEISRAQKEFKPDIIIGVTSILSNYWGVKSANKHNIPFIYYWTDVIHTLVPFELFRWVAKIMEKRIIKNSTELMVINEELKDCVIELGADPNTIQVIPGGIDFQRFNPHIDPSPVRKKYGLSENDFVAYFMGWIYEFSGLKEMLLEFVKYKDSHPNFKFLIVGEGEYFSNIRNLVESNNLGGQVVLAGLRPYEEIPQLIAASDVCLLPSRNNDIMDRIVPIKMYEYLSMYKPVISTKLPGVIKEFGQDNGVIYVDSPEEVIKKLIELNANYSDFEFDKIKNFIKRYNWDYIVPTFEEAIRSLVGPN